MHYYAAMFQIFIVSNISPSRGKQYVHFYQYVKCLLLRIYLPVGVNNMHTFIQQYFKCLLFRIYPRVGENHMCILYPYVKCLLFRIYTRLGVNNMCTFTAIFSMFAVSHMSPCRGK